MLFVLICTTWLCCTAFVLLPAMAAQLMFAAYLYIVRHRVVSVSVFGTKQQNQGWYWRCRKQTRLTGGSRRLHCRLGACHQQNFNASVGLNPAVGRFRSCIPLHCMQIRSGLSEHYLLPNLCSCSTRARATPSSW